MATLENSYDKLYVVRALTPQEIFAEEPKLLKLASGMMPCLYFENPDVLVVDRIGKNISGPGMDPNITRTYLPGAPIPQELRDKRAQRVAVLDLTEETHGAAMGIGMADVTTRRLLDKMDFEKTYPNCLTSGVTISCHIPMVLDNDRLCLQAAIKTLTNVDRSALRMARIKDTLHMGEVWYSEALLPAAQADPRIEVLSEPEEICFDEMGNLF